MTFRQILAGVALGLLVAAAPHLWPVPDPVGVLGPIIIISAFAIGGADGTLPRRV